MAVDWALQQNNFLGRLDSWGSLFNSGSGRGSNNWGSSSNWSNSWDKAGEGSSDNWGMVDDVLGGVVGHVLLDGNLGNMMDLVVDLVSNMLNNWGSGNSMDSWDSSSICNSWGSNGLDLSSLDSNWGSNMMDSWGSNSIGHSWGSNSLDLSSLNLNWGNSLDSNWGSSIGNSWSSNGVHSNSLADWINESILVKVLRESLESN